MIKTKWKELKVLKLEIIFGSFELWIYDQGYFVIRK